VKLAALLRDVGAALEAGGSCLIFSGFTGFLDQIGAALGAAQPARQFVRLDGRVSQADRSEALWRFRQGEVSLFLISSKAGGLGLNLTDANTVFIMEPDWNPTNEAQVTYIIAAT